MTLTFYLLSLKLVCFIVRGVSNLPTNFCVPRTLRSRLIGQQLPDGLRDLATLTFNSGGHCAYQRYGSTFFVCVQS